MLLLSELELALQKKKEGVFLSAYEKRIILFNTHRKTLEKKFNKKLTDIQVRYLERGVRYIGYWDIETSDFNPYQNFMICYCFTRRDIITGKKENFEYHITKQDITKAVKNNNFNFDVILLRKLSECMESCDMIEGHYSTKFDMPFFRSRCLLTKQPELIPPHGKLKYSDTWRKMKTTLKANRNTLNNLNLIVSGKSDKTFVELEYWYKVRFKDSPQWQKSINYILKHCRQDVKDSVRNGIAIESFNNIPGGLT